MKTRYDSKISEEEARGVIKNVKKNMSISNINNKCDWIYDLIPLTPHYLATL